MLPKFRIFQGWLNHITSAGVVWDGDLIKYGREELRQSLNKHLATLLPPENIGERTFDKWVSGISTIPPELPGYLYKATGNDIFLSVLFVGLDLRISKITVEVENKDISEEMLDVHHSVGNLTSYIKKMAKDGFTDKEKGVIRLAAQDSIREIEEILEVVEND